ncbi:MAG: hypothetical protein JWO80_5881 [Bryobacterales bacterium]|nr:hypothetical protein [Bryobacterales bacterium]
MCIVDLAQICGMGETLVPRVGEQFFNEGTARFAGYERDDRAVACGIPARDKAASSAFRSSGERLFTWLRILSTADSGISSF